MTPFLTFGCENRRLSGYINLVSKLTNETGRSFVNTVCQALFSHLGWAFSLPKPITLDFSRFLTDTSCITPVPPLPLVGDVHLGWVFLCPDGIFLRQGGPHE
jgi:hypothetical protein